MIGSSDETLQIVIKARDDASKVLNGFKGKVEGMKPTFQKMAVAGTAAFVGLGATMKATLEDGLQSASIDQAFQRMTQSANINGDALISKLEEVSKGTVATTDLMLASNKAMALGVGNDMETMTKLMEIARVKGQNMGLDTTQAFNDIVTGIGRGSPLILDNLGINIKLTAAQEQYAASLGKTADQLTDAESSQALLNAVLMQGSAELESLGEVALTPAERLQQLNKQFADAKSTLGEALIPVMEKLVATFIPIISKIGEWVKNNPKLTATIAAVTLGVSALVAVVGTLGLLLPPVIAGFGLLLSPVVLVTGAVAAVASAAILARDNFSKLPMVFKILLGPLAALGEGLKQLWGLITKVASGISGAFSKATTSVDAFQSSVYNVDGKFIDFTAKLPEQSKKIDSVATSLGGVSKEAGEAATKVGDLQKEMAGIFEDINKTEAGSKQQLAEAIIEQEKSITDKKSELRKLERAEDTDANATRIRELRKTISQEQDALKTAADIRDGLRTEIAEAERRADLTAFERKIEDIQRERVARLQAQVVRLEEIKLEIAAEKMKSTAIASSFGDAQSNMQDSIVATRQVAEEEAEKMKKAFDRAISSMEHLNIGGSSSLRVSSSRLLSARSIGGPVAMSTPYKVGERGPEVFVPNTSGRIVRNSDLTGGGNGNTFVVNVNNPKLTTYDDIRQTKMMIERSLRTVVRDQKMQTT